MKKAIKQSKSPRHIRIAYIGGGSRGWAHKLMSDLALCPDLTGDVALYDIDRPMALLNARWASRVNESPDALSQWTYTVPRTLKDALTGADFVFCSIQPGPIEMMQHDLEIPRKYGILHPVGDTVGPAGLCRSLRSVIDYAEIARAVERYAPRAWVVNFTNPMSVCTRTLYKVFPEIKAIGCCHEVFGTQDNLARILKEYHNIDATRDQIRVNVLGVNHFTWIDKARYNGIDLLELLQRKLKQKDVIRPITDEEIEKQGYFTSTRQVQYDLLRRYGVLAAAGDRHLAEFVPFYLKDQKTMHRWGVKLTPFHYRITRYTTAPDGFRKRLRDKTPFELKESSEEAVRQIKGILGMEDFRTNVNLPNVGQIAGLPQDAVVETNAYFTHDSVKPEFSGQLPPAVEALVLRPIYSQEMIVEAGLRKDKDLAFQAFLNDPLMSLPTDRAWKMFTEMLRATKRCLPGWKV